MGYQRPPLKLTYADGEFAGLEIRLKRLAIGTYAAIEDLLNKLISTDDKTTTMHDVVALMRELAKALSDGILSWNYETEDGTPVPPTVEGILAHTDMAMLRQIVEDWIETVGGIDSDLKGESTNGDSELPEETMPVIPME